MKRELKMWKEEGTGIYLSSYIYTLLDWTGEEEIRFKWQNPASLKGPTGRDKLNEHNWPSFSVIHLRKDGKKRNTGERQKGEYASGKISKINVFL